MIIVIKLFLVQLAIFTMYSYATQGTDGSEQCDTPLGVENGQIPDSAMSASSQWNDYWGPRQGRLNNQNRCWLAHSLDLGPWLQIDLGSVTKITGLATQGCKGIYKWKAWVETYTLSYSVDCGHFEPYNGGQVLRGNISNNSPKRRKLNTPIQTRCIRVKPKTWVKWPTMRVELYGCEGECNQPLGMESRGIADGRMSASSEYNYTHAANRARLNLHASPGWSGAWVAKINDLNQWLSVDFVSVMNLTAIVTQGRQDSDQWVTNYTVSYSKNNSNYREYKKNGQMKIFSANTARNSTVLQVLCPPIVTRYIRIHPRSWHGNISMRVEFLGCAAECNQPLGMEDGSIADDQISASSEYNETFGASSARLNFGSADKGRAWSAKTNDADQWLKVDFGSVINVTAIETQGLQHWKVWVTEYAVSYSTNNSTYLEYNQSGQVKVFSANKDQDSIVQQVLSPPIVTRYIRIHPMSWHGNISMRVEFLGCAAVPECSRRLGMEDGRITDDQITASSAELVTQGYGASRARLNLEIGPLSTGAWVAEIINANQWLKVDFASVMKVTAIETQGRQISEWVTEYTVEYSLSDSINYDEYKQNGQVKNFSANTDSNSVVQQDLSPPIVTRYIRIHPRSWHGRISMRVEFRGCAAVDGGWTEFGEWGKCSQSCGGGEQSRSRTCTNPPPAHGGAQCSGDNRETQACNVESCLVNGGWSKFGDWGECSKLCGGGEQERVRTCTHPPPSNGGAECAGPDRETQGCSASPCPVDGGWTEFGEWGKCSQSCGGGEQSRSRTCTNPPPAHGGAQCSGDNRETQACNVESCLAVQVMYTVRLIDETWKEDLNNVTSDARKEMMEMIKTNVKKEDYENSIDKVTITDLREGSVIATFNVTYRRLDSIQLLAIQESLANKRLGDVSAELIDVITDNVPNQKPNIIEALPNDSTSINITWSSVSPNPNGAPLLGYSIYYRRINEKYRPDVLQTVEADITTITLKNLEKFTKYAIRVLAFTKSGNGLCSKRVFVWTDESVPSRPPPNVEVFVHSSTKMTVTWDDIDRTHVHGILQGYKVSYKSHKESENPEWKNTTLSSSTTSLVLKGLQKFTAYSIVICAYTSKGCGVESHQVKRTREDVPSLPPPRVTLESFFRSIRINWGSFPEEHVHGVLLGFKLTYQLIRASGLRVRDTKETLLTLRPKELSAVLQDLRSSSAYKIKLAAFTAMGTGPYSEHMIAETCRCPEVLYTNYWAHPPYVRRLENGKVEGIFPKILKDMVRVACGKCSSASVETSLNMTSNGHDKDAFKSSLTTVLRDIDEVPQIHFPINGNKYITKYMGNYSYVYLVESPGVVFVAVSDPPSTHASILFRAALNVGFSLGILVLCSIIVSGFLFWMLERKLNPQEFSPSFFRGICDGMWWSFVSMTTVGYGDKNARTFIGRCFAIAWTLIGLVNMSVVVSSISTELTTVTVSKDSMIYGSKVAAIHNSTEHRLGILMNAVVNKDRQYRNIKEIRRALETREVQGALVDTYVAAEHREELFTEGVRVNRVLDKPFGYGIILSGAAANAKKYFDDYIKNNIHTILHTIENDTSILSVPEKSTAEETSAGLFDSSSSAFQWTVKVVGGILAIATLLGLVWHYGIFLAQNKQVTPARAQMEGQIKEMLQIMDKLYKATNELKQTQKQRIREFLKRHKKSSRTDQHSSPQTELTASPVLVAVVCESRDTSRELVASEIQKSFWDGENFIEEINFMALSKIPNIGQPTNNKQERQVDYELVDVKSS